MKCLQITKHLVPKRPPHDTSGARRPRAQRRGLNGAYTFKRFDGEAHQMTQEKPVVIGISLLSGGIAGTAVDVTLFPLDTLKTRLQSAEGFAKSGGFRGIYAGLASAASGSAPSAATFFCSYELTKNLLKPRVSSTMFPFVHMFAATVGEVMSLFVRNPFEVVKQRAQAYTHLTSLQALKYTLKEEGFLGLYRGYWNTLSREIPFALMQYPLWELLKSIWSWEQGHPVWAWQSGICGAVSGGVSAAVTTPLDVAKTRVMLAPFVFRSYDENGMDSIRWSGVFWLL
ncbi:mitochondrial S-adenosylmethionine carrier protein-like isoform X2 [Montipora foliosa]|uniref:mitochondrial S-adenosylmethionine carrier protein-like isoform X2 n=1 Tax=Montipora foliosa TaxID=591990 RepID=UPI0035F1EA12